MPILTVTGGATVREGEKAIFTVSLTSALTQDVWFRASTITSAGASSADGDYDAILDKLYFIPAGSKKINISVQTYNAGTQNEGLEGVGLWVDEVYHYDVSIGGNGKGYVTILDTIPPIELSVRNTSGNEGNKIGFIVQAENPVLYDTTVYLQVQGTTTAGIASGNWWVAGLIKSGQTSTTVNISTIDDGQSGNRRIDVKLFSYYEEVVMLDDTAYGTVYNTTLNQLPILDIFADSDVNEGQETTSYARLSFAVNYDVTFQVSTWLGDASGDANRNPDSPDYEYLLNKTFTIYAGTLTAPIPVQTLPNKDPTDWAQEVFSIRVEPGSVSGATLGQARADILIKDVAIAPPVQDAPIISLYGVSESELQEGSEGWFTVQSDRATNGPITVGIEVVSGASDITVLNESVTFTPNTEMYWDFIKIRANLDADNINETFTIRLTEPADGSYAISTSNTVTTTILDDTVINLSTELQPYEDAFATLEQNKGTSNAATMVQNSFDWLRIAKTLWDNGSAVVDRFITKGLSLIAATAYADEEALPDLLNLEAVVANAKPFDGPAPTSVNLNEPVYWTFEQAKTLGDGKLAAGNLKAGDYVYHKVTDDKGVVSYESQFVLDQLPVFWSKTFERDGYIGTRSIQGSHDETTFSHNKNFANSLDISPISGQPMYVVSPATGTVVFSQNNATTAEDNAGLSGLGNVVTIKLDAKTASGDNIYMTLAHMATGSVIVSAGDTLTAGQVLGEVGNTGGYNVGDTWTLYDKHLHIQVGTELRNNKEVPHSSDGKIVDGNGVEDFEIIPPIYFSTFQQDENVTVYGGEGQNPGFPIGYKFPLITGITPTFSIEKFAEVNPGYLTVFSNGEGNAPTEDWHWYDESFSGSQLNGDEFIFGGAGKDEFVASTGNDIIYGGDDYNQVTVFAASWNEIQIGYNSADNSIHTYHQNLGYDTHYEIDGWWSQDGGWISWNSMVEAADSSFVFM